MDDEISLTQLVMFRSCPRQVRRLLEFVMLVKACLCFLLLVYIHFVYTRHPVQCLEHISSSWPREGILRVEIVRSPPEDYNIEHSYHKEKQLAKRNKVMDQLPTFIPSFLYFPYEGAEKLEAEAEAAAEEGSGEEEAERELDSKISEEILAMPGEFEKLKEEWKKSNDTSGPSSLSSSLDLMKERLSNMQELLRERETDRRPDASKIRPAVSAKVRATATKMQSVFMNISEELDPNKRGEEAFKAIKHFETEVSSKL